MGDLTMWVPGDSVGAGRGAAASDTWGRVSGSGAGGAAPTGVGPFAWTVARFTSLILNPSRSSSNSTKLLASMYSISSLISSSKRPPPRPISPGLPRPLWYRKSARRGWGGRAACAATGAAAPRRPDGRLPDRLLQLQAGPPGFVAGPPRDAVRADDHAQEIVRSQRTEDRQARSGGDRDLLERIRRQVPKRGGRPLHHVDPFGRQEIDVDILPRRHLLHRDP